MKETMQKLQEEKKNEFLINQWDKELQKQWDDKRE